MENLTQTITEATELNQTSLNELNLIKIENHPVLPKKKTINFDYVNAAFRNYIATNGFEFPLMKYDPYFIPFNTIFYYAFKLQNIETNENEVKSIEEPFKIYFRYSEFDVDKGLYKMYFSKKNNENYLHNVCYLINRNWNYYCRTFNFYGDDEFYYLEFYLNKETLIFKVLRNIKVKGYCNMNLYGISYDIDQQIKQAWWKYYYLSGDVWYTSRIIKKQEINNQQVWRSMLEFALNNNKEYFVLKREFDHDRYIDINKHDDVFIAYDLRSRMTILRSLYFQDYFIYNNNKIVGRNVNVANNRLIKIFKYMAQTLEIPFNPDCIFTGEYLRKEY